jgi:hypothetical protein
MPKPADLTGQKFGKLTVKTKAYTDANGRVHWHCQCDCGGESFPITSNLKSGKTKSCPSCPRGTHGDSEKPEHKAWKFIKRQGEIPETWNQYVQFLSDIGRRPSPEHELARHDIREPHGPTNTYWRNENEEREYRRSLRMCDEFVIHMRAIIDPGTGEATGTGKETPRLFTWNPPPQGNRTTAERPWFAMFPGEKDDEDASPSSGMVAGTTLTNCHSQK